MSTEGSDETGGGATEEAALALESGESPADGPCGKGMGFGVKLTWVQIPVLPLRSCGT